jgi:VanZ family protein
MKGLFRRDGSVLIAYCTLIFLLSHQSTLPMPLAFPHQDKLSHLLAYAVMAVLVWRTFSHHLSAYQTLAFVTVAFCSFYGVTDEYHQSFIEGRNSDIADWFADTLGAVIAAAVMGYQYRLRHMAHQEQGSSSVS